MTDAQPSTRCPSTSVLQQMIHELQNIYEASDVERRQKRLGHALDRLAETKGRIETADELGMEPNREGELLDWYRDAANHVACAGLNLYNIEERARNQLR